MLYCVCQALYDSHLKELVEAAWDQKDELTTALSAARTTHSNALKRRGPGHSTTQKLEAAVTAAEARLEAWIRSKEYRNPMSTVRTLCTRSLPELAAEFPFLKADIEEWRHLEFADRLAAVASKWRVMQKHVVKLKAACG